MVLPHEVRVLERSSMSASAVDASTGRSSLRPAACALYRVGIRHATLLRWHRELSKRRWGRWCRWRFPEPTSAMNLGVSPKVLKYLGLIHIPVS
jgi:hypothetical protein